LDIEIEEDKITIEEGDTKISLQGVLSKKHAIILVGLILALLGIKEFDIPM
tara:strand:- start:1143 stop:1295 length:153 start_codon:yes stop_codon:yes gene_type:complete